MIFKNKSINYEELLNFLITDFNYKLIEKDDSKKNFYSKYIYSQHNLPDIQVILESGCLSIEVKIENSFWGLPNVYKFLNHDKIVKCRYQSEKDLFDNFEKNTKEYLTDLIINKEKISNDKLESFYKEFPQYVFVWN